jgi:head-tail adaptor
MQAGALRERVRVERRSTASDGYGNEEGAFAALFDDTLLPAKIRPASQGRDGVLAARLEGTVVFNVWLRQDSLSRQLLPDDRLVWVRPEGEVILNIRGPVVDPDGMRAELQLTCEQGVAT